MRRYACLPRRVRFFIASLLIRVWNFTGSCVRTASPTGQLLRRMTKLSTEAQIQDEPTRRDFLFIATAAMGAVGVGGLAWPFIAQMNPDASALALSTSEVDIGSMQPGEQVSVMWRGKPVFIRYRTEEEIAEAEAVDVNDLPDGNARLDVDPGLPATNENRSVPRKSCVALDDSAFARILAVSRCRKPAILAAGSAPATARITTRRAEFAAVRRRKTCPFRSMSSFLRQPFASARPMQSFA
jgi:Rieske Fe-S protein